MTICCFLANVSKLHATGATVAVCDRNMSSAFEYGCNRVKHLTQDHGCAVAEGDSNRCYSTIDSYYLCSPGLPVTVMS